MYKKIIVLGSTGSIGTQTLDVCRMHNIKVVALSANRSVIRLKNKLKNLNRNMYVLPIYRPPRALKKRRINMGLNFFPAKKVLSLLQNLIRML